MNDKVKSYLQIIYGYRWLCIIAGIVILLTCVWLYANKSSNIDTTGIQRATTEVDNARQYNRRAVEDNRRARTAIERSQDVNDRIERTITRSQELIGAARANADNAKRIVGESQRILRDADSRTTESKDATTE